MELANRPFGCQARPWLQAMGLETFTTELPNVMRTISETGYSGFETALAVLPLNDPGQFAAWRNDANDLRLAAAHTGGAWWEPDKRDSISDLLRQFEQLPGLGCDQVMLSIGAGVVDLSDEDLVAMAGTLAELARNAAGFGVQIAVHNHAAELSAGARVLTTLMDVSATSGLKLGADLGWVAHAEVDPIAFIDEFGEHLAYLHIRD
ncbi:MAG: TIM barrel protein, partial [Thermomicrobiales bacterium]